MALPSLSLILVPFILVGVAVLIAFLGEPSSSARDRPMQNDLAMMVDTFANIADRSGKDPSQFDTSKDFAAYSPEDASDVNALTGQDNPAVKVEPTPPMLENTKVQTSAPRTIQSSQPVLENIKANLMLESNNSVELPGTAALLDFVGQDGLEDGLVLESTKTEKKWRCCCSELTEEEEEWLKTNQGDPCNAQINHGSWWSRREKDGRKWSLVRYKENTWNGPVIQMCCQPFELDDGDTCGQGSLGTKGRGGMELSTELYFVHSSSPSMKVKFGKKVESNKATCGENEALDHCHKNRGKLSIHTTNQEQEFSCDCAGTRYHGDRCDQLCPDGFSSNQTSECTTCDSPAHLNPRAIDLPDKFGTNASRCVNWDTCKPYFEKALQTFCEPGSPVWQANRCQCNCQSRKSKDFCGPGSPVPILNGRWMGCQCNCDGTTFIGTKCDEPCPDLKCQNGGATKSKKGKCECDCLASGPSNFYGPTCNDCHDKKSWKREMFYKFFNSDGEVKCDRCTTKLLQCKHGTIAYNFRKADGDDECACECKGTPYEGRFCEKECAPCENNGKGPVNQHVGSDPKCTCECNPNHFLGKEYTCEQDETCGCTGDCDIKSLRQLITTPDEDEVKLIRAEQDFIKTFGEGFSMIAVSDLNKTLKDPSYEKILIKMKEEGKEAQYSPLYELLAAGSYKIANGYFKKESTISLADATLLEVEDAAMKMIQKRQIVWRVKTYKRLAKFYMSQEKWRFAYNYLNGQGERTARYLENEAGQRATRAQSEGYDASYCLNPVKTLFMLTEVLSHLGVKKFHEVRLEAERALQILQANEFGLYPKVKGLAGGNLECEARFWMAIAVNVIEKKVLEGPMPEVDECLKKLGDDGGRIASRFEGLKKKVTANLKLRAPASTSYVFVS